MSLSEPKTPSVTVIMPVRNERDFISESLGAVLNQDYPESSVQVLVVDGMSDDGTREAVRHVASRHSDRDVRLLDNPGRIVPKAFNRGLREASGEVIIRVDGHCRIGRDYIRRCVRTLSETGADNVGGLQRAVGTSWISRAIAAATASPFGVGNAVFHYREEPGWVETVYLGAWPREVFDRIGGFDEDLARNQDDEFNFRLAQAGGKIWLDPSIRAIYYSRGSLRKLWRQYYEYGLYKVLVIRKRGAVASLRHLVPATCVLAFAGSGIMAAAGMSRPLWTIAGTYATAGLLASIHAGRREPSLIPGILASFPVLHFSYGAGFLRGLWSWRKSPEADRSAERRPQNAASQ